MTNPFIGRTATELEQNITALEQADLNPRLLELAWTALLNNELLANTKINRVAITHKLDLNIWV